MKNLSEMSAEEFQIYVSELMKSYTENKVETSIPKCFIYEGVLFNENTPKEHWDWLEKELA